MSGILDQAGASVRPADAPAFETVREYVTDPDASNRAYAVERNVSTSALVLTVKTTPREGEPRLKRISLAPVARALALGVID